MPKDRGRFFSHVSLAAAAVCVWSMSASWALPRVDEVEAQLPTAFLPGGVLGMRPGGSWEASKRNPALLQMNCQAVGPGVQFDEVCFFRTSAASRVAGAAIHDGFIVRQGNQTHLAFQHKGDEVLFARPLARRLSPEELAGQLAHEARELALLYGYLGPVNVFGALAAE